jgi:beta-glucanase (GH16 family)
LTNIDLIHNITKRFGITSTMLTLNRTVPLVAAFVLLTGLIVKAQTEPAPATTTLGERPGWTLSFQDEFSGPYGTAVDESKWRFDQGGNGWGNEELQYYTNTRHNAMTDGSGRLVIRARAEPETAPYICAFGQKCAYTSARLNTKEKFTQAYGRFEARVRIPAGQGLWPAFWLLGDTIAEQGWPSTGEIDVMETIGREPTLAHGTIHGPGYSGGNAIGAPVSLPDGAAFAAGFHTFAIEWQPNQIRWLLDDLEYQVRTPSDLPAGTKWVFDHPMFLILNLAVGGKWPGRPDASTVFPADLLVDYVRVYRKES